MHVATVARRLFLPIEYVESFIVQILNHVFSRQKYIRKMKNHPEEHKLSRKMLKKIPADGIPRVREG
jgi:hypothetical protein